MADRFDGVKGVACDVELGTESKGCVDAAGAGVG